MIMVHFFSSDSAYNSVALRLVKTSVSEVRSRRKSSEVGRRRINQSQCSFQLPFSYVVIGGLVLPPLVATHTDLVFT